MTAGFKYDDGGRGRAGFKGSAGDCVTRAVAIATGLPYMDVYTALSHGMRTRRNTSRGKRKASARDGVNTKRQWFKDYMRGLGWVWVPTMAIGSGCTVHLHAAELPGGRLIVAVSRHYTAVINGVIHDTHDPRDRGSTFYTDGYTGVIPKGARRADSDTGWIYAPQRCVYGYWHRPEVV